MEQVVLGLSGGVDSAVSAKLLQNDGYEVRGLYLDIGTDQERDDAIRTAQFLQVPLEIRDIREELEEHVCEPFACSYLRGETPNPCIACNPSVKFQNLCAYADQLGASFIATGHYARTIARCLYMGRPENDQSYMLCRLHREQAERLILPLGNYAKEEVRAMAADFGIPVANKPDSMEICFIRDKDYIGWLSRRCEVPPPGRFVLDDGTDIGEHAGIHRYTVGQRWKGLYNERKLYIAEIRPETNEIVLRYWEELFRTEFRVRDLRWLTAVEDGPVQGRVRIRHTKWETPLCTVYPENGGALIRTEEPIRAPARGQAAAIYCGEQLLGGGTII